MQRILKQSYIGMKITACMYVIFISACMAYNHIIIKLFICSWADPGVVPVVIPRSSWHDNIMVLPVF